MALAAIRDNGSSPTPTTWRLHVLHAAIYDAWTAYDDASSGLYLDVERPAVEATEANQATAISHAAYRVLTAVLPTQAAKFTDFMEALGYDTTDTSEDLGTAVGVGNSAAAAALAARLADGSNAAKGFADTSGYRPVNGSAPGADNAPGGDDFDPNHWQPLRVPTGNVVDADGTPIVVDDNPDSYTDQTALTPHWGKVMPFAIVDVRALLPPPPPKLGDPTPYTDALGNVSTNDQAYRDQIAEVIDISANLTPEQKLTAEYWADGPRSEAPPGHWNQIAQDISLREGHGMADDAKMFFALNNGLLDASILTWATKYEYDSIRPQSAIHHLYADQEIEAWAGPNQGTKTILGQDFRPYQESTVITPPFPEYTSGHSAFSAAAATVLSAYTGTDAFYDGVTRSRYDLDGDGERDLLGEYVSSDLTFEDYDGPPITLRWETLSEAADEAGLSRLYGGIHIASGDLFGRELGRTVGESAFALSTQYFEGAGDDRREADPDGQKLVGGPGNDRLLGSASTDILVGGPGRDRLVGGAGDDQLDGGEGKDVVRGGPGHDTIWITTLAGGPDRIVGFDPSEDAFLVAASLFADGAPEGLDGFVAFADGRLLLDADGGGDDFAAVAHLVGGAHLDAEAVLSTILIA